MVSSRSFSTVNNSDCWHQRNLLASFRMSSNSFLSTGFTNHNSRKNVRNNWEDNDSFHFAFLASSVPVISDMFENLNLTDKREAILIIEDVEPKIIGLFIDLLYKGSCFGNQHDIKYLRELMLTLNLSWDLSLSECEDNSLNASVNSSDSDICISQCFDYNDNVGIVGCLSNSSCDESEIYDDSALTRLSFEPDRRELLCSRFCSLRCYRIYEQWSHEDVLKLASLFVSEDGKLQETKNNLLNHLWGQHNIGEISNHFVVNKQTFCTKFFSKVTGISEYILQQVLDAFRSGRRMFIHGSNGGIKQPTVATTNFICWLKLFAESYGQFAPDTNTVVLCYWTNKKYLFNIYSMECQKPHLSKSAFYQNFDKYFSFKRADKSLPHIVISKYSSHSVCNQCVALNNFVKQCKTEVDLKMAIYLKNQHKMVFGEARRKIQEIKQSAVQFPSDNLFIQVIKSLKKAFINL